MTWWGQLLAQGISDTNNFLFTERQNRKNEKMQYDFAQNGISWKVQDAKRSGIHPLYALGASTQSPSFGGQAPSFGKPDFSQMGEKTDNEINELLKERQREEIKLLKAQRLDIIDSISKRRSIGTANGTEGFDIVANDSNTIKTARLPEDQPKVIEQPATQTASGGDGMSAGKMNTEVMFNSAEGYYTPRISRDASEPMESSWFDQFGYMYIRGTRVLKAFYYYHNQNAKGAKEHRAFIRKLRAMIPEPAGKGMEWRFNPLKGFTRKPKKGLLYESPKEFQVKQGYRSMLEKILNPMGKPKNYQSIRNKIPKRY